MQTKNMNEIIKEVYNGTILTVKKVIPLSPNIGSPELISPPLTVSFGVLIGFTGDLKGELVLQADSFVFNHIGEKMFGMPLSEDMLDSFAGELGNMMAGSLSTYLASIKIKTDITYPTVLKGDAQLTGFKRSFFVTIQYDTVGNLDVYLLLNQ
ncbi:CheY-P phosphatase CheX [Paraliobacillus sp. PM-2]|uniref:chemotaxis protein CheX n=1 Tax=Paraliobacillus sp. PM-2 TaxID=1462524 RepID=UPI00061CA3C6|nr:chemotaxis protein CheX [Paraliobacillus sp. PM-2]CQR46515.1 CheY-P phosphatase CheX [Paraliobacillus sp. PM-2]